MAGKRIETQDLIDIDGYRADIKAARADYREFADGVVQMSAEMKKATAASFDELKQLRALTATGNLNSAQVNEVVQRTKELSAQIDNQRTARDGLTRTEQQYGKTLTALQTRQDKLIEQLGSLDGLEAKASQQRKRAITELGQLATQTNRLSQVSQVGASSTREVAGQYNRLQKELTEARVSLRSMSDAFDESTGRINQNNAEAVRLAGIIQRNDTMLRQFDSTLKVHSRNIGNYPKSVSGSVAALTDLAAKFVTLEAIMAGAKWFYTQSRDLENYDRALREVTTSEQDFANSKMYLIGLADKLGIEYTTLIDRYKQLRDATKDTVLEGEPAHKLFTALTTAGAKLGLSNEVIGGTLNAVIQIVGKGRAQMEELRQQLGERLPSSLRLMAAGLGISQEKLFKLSEQGELLAKDILPAFATQLGLAYSLKNDEKITAIAASTARVVNETNLLVETMNNNKGITSFWDEITHGAQNSLRAIRLFIQDGSWTELIQFVGPNSLFAKTAERFRKENAVTDFAGKGEGDRYLKLQELRKQEAEQERAGLTNDARITRDIRRKLQDMDFRATVAEMKQAKKNEGIEARGAVEKNDADLLRFQKQSARKRAAELIALEQQLAKDKGNAELIAKVDTYTRLDAEQRTREKQVSDRLKEQRGKSDAERQRERDALLREGLSLTKQQTGTQVSALDTAKASGAISEADYLNQRLTVVQDGLLKEQELLRKAGKEKTAEYAATEKEINALAAWYLKERSELEEKAFKQAVDAVSNAIESDTGALKGQLTQRIADLQTAYADEETRIKKQVADRQISEAEGEERLANLKIQLLKDVAAETAANSDLIQRMAQTRLDNLTEKLRSEGATEIDIAKALADEKKKIEKEYNESLKESSEQRIKINESENEKKRKADEKAAELRKRIEDTIWEAAGKAVNGFFEVSTSFRDADLARLDKQKARELEMVGDNAEAKAQIERKFDQQSRELKRKQAIADKEQAIFNVLLSSSMAIWKAFAEFGPVFGAPLALALGGLAAIEIGVIAARKIPEFFRGTSDAPEGPAWVGERGYELIESKQGGKSQYRLAAEKQITYLNKHDRVYTHQETKRMLATNAELAHEVRSAPGGGLYAPPIINSGMDESTMLRVMRQVFGEMTWEKTTFDENGVRQYTEKQNNRTEWLNKRMSYPRSGKP